MDEKKTRLESKGQEKGVKAKAAEVKDTVSEKGEEVKAKAAEVKDTVSDKGEEVKIKATEAKDTVSDRSKEIKENATVKTEELRTTAEKVVNDVLKTIREKQEDLGKTINDYTAPNTPYVDLVDTPTEFILIADPGISDHHCYLPCSHGGGRYKLHKKGKGSWRSYPYPEITGRDQN